MDSTTHERRLELYNLLGDIPQRRGAPIAQKIGEAEHGSYVLETLLLDLNGVEAVPAYFVRPRQGASQRLPVILYNHAHGGDYEIGKNELIAGRAGLQQPPYAEALVGQGYAVLSIDAWAFGERGGRTESEIFKLMLWQGRVMWGMMVFDSLRAIDYLAHTGRRGHSQAGHAWHVDGQHHGMVGRGAGRTRACMRGSLLSHGLSGTDRHTGSGWPRRVLLRAASAPALQYGTDQRADCATGPSQSCRQL